jgi:hypothetical protein
MCVPFFLRLTGHDRCLEEARTTAAAGAGAQARWLGHGEIELAGYLAGQLKGADLDCASGPRVTREQPDDAYRGALPHAMTAGNEREK